MSVQHYFIDRPQAANSLDIETALDIQNKLKLAVKSGVKVFVLSSVNPQLFCAGGDLKVYATQKSKAAGVKMNRQIREILKSFSTMPIFIVACVQGDCIGGGCELALACDYIVAAESSRFSFRQSSLGLTPGWGGAVKLLERVRKSTALLWLAGGQWISAGTALRAGFVDEVVPNRELMKPVERLLNELQSVPHHLLGEIKKIVEKKGMNEEKVFEKLWFSDLHRAALKRFSTRK